MQRSQPPFDGKLKAIEIVDLFDQYVLTSPFFEFADSRIIFQTGVVIELMVQYRLPGYPGSIYRVTYDEFRDCEPETIVKKALHDFEEVFYRTQALERAGAY